MIFKHFSFFFPFSIIWIFLTSGLLFFASAVEEAMKGWHSGLYLSLERSCWRLVTFILSRMDGGSSMEIAVGGGGG